jgi:hypothetical protein
MRFQKSPFSDGIRHQPAWSIFLDLHPPFMQSCRLSGKVTLVVNTQELVLWKFNKTFDIAWPHQDACTRCRRRLNLEEIVKSTILDGGGITLRVRMVAGPSANPRLAPMQHDVERLPFSVTVGTTSLTRRFGWNLRPYYTALTLEFINFWKGLRDRDGGGLNRLKYSPLDLVKAVTQGEIASTCLHKGCAELNKFVISAVHESETYAVIPYHLVYMDFDLLDPSGDEAGSDEEPWYIEVASDSKVRIIRSMLDWIVRKPLYAAYSRHKARRCATGTDSGQPPIISPDTVATAAVAAATAAPRMSQCNGCCKVVANPRKCSACKTVSYCSEECQRQHWRHHRAACREIRDALVRRQREEETEATNYFDGDWTQNILSALNIDSRNEID